MLVEKGLRLMQDKSKDLCIYHIKSALETLEATKVCIDSKHYKDACESSTDKRN